MIDPKRIVKKTFFILVTLFLILSIITIYLFYPRNVEIFSELEPVFSERETTGHQWKIIPSNEIRVALSKMYQIEMPKIDFSKHYLLWADGRRVKSLSYTIGSIYLHSFDYYAGKINFIDNHEPHRAFFYIIEKMYLIAPI